MLYQIIFRSGTFPFRRDTAIQHPVMDLIQIAHAFLRSTVWKRTSLEEPDLRKEQSEDREGVLVCHG